MGEFNYIGTAALTKLARQALRGAVVQAAEDLVGKAQAETPVDTGTLRASIHVASVSGSGSNASIAQFTATVATGGEANDYAIFVHEGTGAHLITGKNGGWLAFDGKFARVVHHPGTRAYKFIERPLLAEREVYIAFLAAAARAAF